MKLIVLTQGKETQVDDSEFDGLSRWQWKARKKEPRGSWYAYRHEKVDGKWRNVSMARQIMGEPAGKLVDHKNGDTLDNRRENLRVATNAQNQHNQRRLRSDNTTGYKGVWFHRVTGRWGAQIQVGERHIQAGYADTPEGAARIYDTAARHYFGEFAAPNFPEVGK